MKDHFSMYRIFPDWQVGYGAFTYEFMRKEGLVVNVIMYLLCRNFP
jgi:hypothetical protein